MFPLRDNVPSIRRPYVTIMIIVLNFLIFTYQFILPDRANVRFVYTYGFLPARLSEELLSGDFSLWTLLPVLSGMFLHGSWLHLLSNMWFMWLFADNVEDRLGHFRFLLFYILSGAAAMALHYVLHPGSAVPAVGASGAIAGVMGAYYVLFPRARITTLVIIVFIPVFINIPAVLYLVGWFVMQVYSGTINALAGGIGDGIAWWAHIGGFLGGIGLLKLFYTPRYYRPVKYDYDWYVSRRYPY
ncbi:MAG: rhomboid family intramembrane serine protease [Clostridia bacterium]|nr:rhomboid family intramembrane serine protease [Clostridia bacterium]